MRQRRLSCWLRNLRLPAWWCKLVGHADWGDEYVNMDLGGHLNYTYYCGRCGE